MKHCPHCHGMTEIRRTETVNNAVRRRRICGSCGMAFNTVELIVRTPNKGGPSFVQSPPFDHPTHYIGTIFNGSGK